MAKLIYTVLYIYVIAVGHREKPIDLQLDENVMNNHFSSLCSIAARFSTITADSWDTLLVLNGA